MKKTFLFLALILSFLLNAQQITDYDFVENTQTFTSISSTGTKIPLASNQLDDGDYTLDLASMGFSFTYCGTPYSSFSVNTNGAVLLGGSGFDARMNHLEGDGTNNYAPVLAPLWDDLKFINYGSDEGIYYEVATQGNGQVLTIEWQNIAHYYHAYVDRRVTFQLKLYSGNGNIEFVYGDMTGANAWGSDCSASIGINNLINGSLAYRNLIAVNPAIEAGSVVENNLDNTEISSIAQGTTYRFQLPPPDCVHYTLLQDDIGLDSETFGVSLADFNGDGWKDVVIIDAYNDIEMYFWDTTTNRMGTTAVSIGGDAWRFGVEAVDIDNDGDMDFVTSPMSSSSGNGIEVWENDGTGNFSLKASNAGGTNATDGHELAVGDINGDGFQDIVFPSSGSNGLRVLINDGNGNFSSNGQTGISVSDPEGATLFDADGDGDLDLAVYRGFADLLFINDGTGQFTQSQELSQDDTEGLAAADVDGDGDLDLVRAPWSGPVELWINDGLGFFMQGASFPASNDGHNEIKIADQNYDGYPDIFTDAVIMLNDANNPGNFFVEETFNNSSHDIDIADLNGDGMIDLYIGRFSSSNGDYLYTCDTPNFVDDSVTACYGESVFLQNDYQTEPGVYYDYIDCDTIKRTTLDFYDEIDTSITESNGTLTVAEAGASYQWLDCDNGNAPIAGATSQSYSPPSFGNYAVEVTKYNNCTVVSDCFAYNSNALAYIDDDSILMYPNPVTDRLQIEAGKGKQITGLEIADITGKLVQKISGTYKNINISLQNQQPGIYLVKIHLGEQTIIKKLVKK